MNSDQTRVTVAQAAELLGLSAEAVRSRVQRGTLRSTKVDGTVYVLLDTDKVRSNNAQTGAQVSDQTAFIASLQEQIDWLRREVERKDTIIMSLTQRIPELEPASNTPSDARERPVTASEEPFRGKTPEEPEEPKKRPWWRRLFE